MARGNKPPDPEKDSDFARGRALAKEKGVGLGIDPESGERGNVNTRQLFNETEDQARSEQVFRDVAKAGGYGDIDPNYVGGLDLRSLKNSVEDNKKFADRAEDKFERHIFKQQAQHQDNVLNDTMEALEKGLKG